MDIASSYTSGSAISDLRTANKTEAETNFNEMMNDINTQTADEDSLYGSVQKAGASVVAVGAIGKGVVTNFQKLKDMVSGKSSKKEGGDDEAEDESETGTEMDTYQIAPTRPSETQEAGDTTEADTEADTTEPTEDTGMFDDGPNPFRGEQDEDVDGFEDTDTLADAVDTDAPLFEEEVTGEDYDATDIAGEFGEEGGDVAGDLGNVTVSTADTAGSLLDPTGATIDVPSEATFEAVGEEGLDLTADATTDAAATGLDSLGSTLGSILSNATSAIGNTASTVGSAVSGAIDGATSAVSGAVDATTGAVEAGVTAGEVAGEVAGSALLQTAGTALDATGVGAPIGLILNIIGGLVLGGTMAAGITGEVEANSNQQTQTTQAQNTLSQATTGGLSNIAGKYAV
jgi:hypothetical protein